MSLSRQLRDAADHQLHQQVKAQHNQAIPGYHDLSTSSVSSLGSLSPSQQQKSRLPQLKVSKSLPSPVNSKSQFERLSGLYDYSVSAGVFAEPTTMTKPITRCVRCSNHASLCMPCTEFLCDESLNFYRKTRARGAIKLFHNAVTEAGLGRLLKFTLFRIWRNTIKKWKQQMMKKKYIVERMFGMNLTAIPFKAWQQYTRQTKISRRDNKIVDLHTKVETLTQSMAQLTESNVELTRQSMANAQERSQLLMKITQQESTINKLTEQLQKERSRVLGLSCLAEPVSVLMTLSEEIRSSISVLIKNQLLDDKGYSFEYHPNMFLDLAASRKSGGPRKLDEIVDNDLGFISSDLSPNAAANKYVLKKWLYEKGREASLRVEPVSQIPLDQFLPDQPPDEPVIGSSYDLTDARLLIRAVVCLCYDVFEDNSSDRFRPAAAVEGADEDAAVGLGLGGASSAKQTLPINVLEEIRSLRKKSPLSIMRIVTRLAHDYLSTPLFKANDLSRGDPNIMHTFVGYLLLTEAPIRPQYTNVDISKFMGEYEVTQRNVEVFRTKNELILEKLFKLQSTWANATDHIVIQSVVAPAHIQQNQHSFKKSTKLLFKAAAPLGPVEDTNTAASEPEGNASAEAESSDGESQKGKGRGKSTKVKFGDGGSHKSAKKGKSKKHSSKNPKSIKESEKESEAEDDDSVAGAGDSEAEGGNTSASADAAAAAALVVEEVPPKPSEAELYAKLSEEVDEFLGTFANMADYENGLLGTVQEIGRDLINVLTLRSKLMSWQSKRQKGMRVASDAHRAAAAFIVESLSSKAELIIGDLDDKFEHRAKKKDFQSPAPSSSAAPAPAVVAPSTTASAKTVNVDVSAGDTSVSRSNSATNAVDSTAPTEIVNPTEVATTLAEAVPATAEA